MPWLGTQSILTCLYMQFPGCHCEAGWSHTVWYTSNGTQFWRQCGYSKHNRREKLSVFKYPKGWYACTCAGKCNISSSYPGKRREMQVNTLHIIHGFKSWALLFHILFLLNHCIHRKHCGCLRSLQRLLIKQCILISNCPKFWCTIIFSTGIPT